jgi:hypothetical protein
LAAVKRQKGWPKGEDLPRFLSEIGIGEPETLATLSDQIDRLVGLGVPSQDAVRVVRSVALTAFRHETGDYEDLFGPEVMAKFNEAMALLAAGKLPDLRPTPYPEWLDAAGDNWIDDTIPERFFENSDPLLDDLIVEVRHDLNDLHHLGVPRKVACTMVGDLMEAVYWDFPVACWDPSDRVLGDLA